MHENYACLGHLLSGEKYKVLQLTLNDKFLGHRCKEGRENLSGQHGHGRWRSVSAVHQRRLRTPVYIKYTLTNPADIRPG